MDYESVVTVQSEARPGVELRVARMSFGRRVELMKRVRELARRVEFFEAGTAADERMEAGLLRAEIDRMFVLWGVTGIAGLRVDGAEATPELLAERGPEDVFREALAAVRRQAGLTEEERKN
jgi:hypothetical protein